MLEWFLQLIQKFAGSIVKVLPLSPFQPYIAAFADLPISDILTGFYRLGLVLISGLRGLVL